MESKELHKDMMEQFERCKQNASDMAAKMLSEPDGGPFWEAQKKNKDTIALIAAKEVSDLSRTFMEELQIYGVTIFGLGYYAKEAEILEGQVDDVVNGSKEV